MTREEHLSQRLSKGQPDLIADLYLYGEADGGKAMPICIGFGCPCCADKSLSEGWDGYPLLEREMTPGERRRVGFVFMSGEDAVNALTTSDRFYLWEGKIIGEARIVR